MPALTNANPFALMMDPDAVVQAMERSERLAGLKRRVHRPLDKPLIPPVTGFHTGHTAFDQSIEADDDTPSADDVAN